MKNTYRVVGVFLCLYVLTVKAQVNNGCQPTADVVFLLDGSDSISSSEFQQQLELMARFVNGSNIGPDMVRVGFAVVSSTVGDAFPLFGSINKDIVLAGINNVTQPQEGSRTDLGLVQMEQMFGAQGRPGVLRIGVIMTDGRAKFEKATEAEASLVKSSGIFLVAIGVGRLIKFSELEKIASTPSNAYSLIPLELSAKLLSGTVNVLGQESCAGHAAALMDLLKPDTNPSGQTMVDMPFMSMAEKIRHDTGSPSTSNLHIQALTAERPASNPELRATDVNQPQQIHVKPNQFFDNNPMYSLLNASLPTSLSQSLGQAPATGSRVEYLPTTPQVETTTDEITVPVTSPQPTITTGFGINFNGGIANTNQFIGPALPDSIFGPNVLPTSASGSNFGVPLTVSKSDVHLPIAQEMIAPNVIAEKSSSPIINDISTPAPIRDVTWPDANVAQDQCSKQRYVNGVAHSFVPNSCNEFMLCHQDMSGAVRMDVTRCPFETFYDEKSAVCKFFEETNCWRDPCFQQNAESYAHSGNCRAYWSCSSRSSVPMCCPLGSSFTPGIGCVRNVTCNDECMDFGNIKSIVARTNCRFLAVENNNKLFFEKVSNMGWMVRPCPPGSSFEQNSCNCVKPDKVFKPSCRPELYLTFEDGVVDKSGNHLAMGNQNVRLDLGSGQFDGQAHLTLWRFSGVSFGQKVKISFRFRTSVWAPKGLLMHIVSNCCFGCVGLPQPSIDIAIIPGDNGGVAVFSATTDMAGEEFLYVHYKDTFTGWNRLTYTYDGVALTGTVNSVTESKNIMGDIQSRPNPLMVGACGQTGAYQGLLDDFEFYMCKAQ